MWKLHITAILTVLTIASAVFFYILKPFTDAQSADLILKSGAYDSILVKKSTGGLSCLQISENQNRNFGLGYLTARDRTAQLTVLQTALRGELAFNLGDDYLWHDIWVKNLNLPVLAKTILQSLSAEEVQSLKLYAAGINAWLQSGNYEPSLPLLALGLKPEKWQMETVLQSLLFFIIEINRQPLKEEFLIQSSRDSRFSTLAAAIYPGCSKLKNLNNQYKWDLFPWQESLFYPEILLQSDSILKCDGDYYFSLYGSNNYPSSLYPYLTANRTSAELHITQPGLPLSIARFNSQRSLCITRTDFADSRLCLIANNEIDLAPEQRFTIKLKDRTPEEYRTKRLQNGFMLSQNIAPSLEDSSFFFYLPADKIIASLHTLLNLEANQDQTASSMAGLKVSTFPDTSMPVKEIQRDDLDYLSAGTGVIDRCDSNPVLNSFLSDSLQNQKMANRGEFKLLKNWQRFYSFNSKEYALFSDLLIQQDKILWQKKLPAYQKFAAVYPVESKRINEQYQCYLAKADSTYLFIPEISNGVKADSFKLKTAAWQQKRAELFLPSKTKLNTVLHTFRKQSPLVLPAVTVKITPRTNRLEYILLSGASEDPGNVYYNYFYEYWHRKLFLPLE